MQKLSMIGYIHDQQRALLDTYERRSEFCDHMIDILKKWPIKKVYLTGSGTSYHASLIIRNYFETYLKVESVVCIPTVFTGHETINVNQVYQKDEILLVAISQSGTSVSTIQAVKKARDEGVHTIALTENLESLITKEAETVIHLTCGKEEIPIETRGYTVTVLTGYLWAVEGAYALDYIKEEEYRDIHKEIKNMLSKLDQVIDESEQWYQANKEELLAMKKGSIAGYGINYATAMEATLKLYETFHQPLNAHELEEMIHGFEMAFGADNYVYIIASKEQELKKIEQFTDFLGELSQHLFLITCEDIPLQAHDLKLSIQTTSDLSPIVYIIPFQVMAARNCENIGYDTSVYPHKRRSFSHKRD